MNGPHRNIWAASSLRVIFLSAGAGSLATAYIVAVIVKYLEREHKVMAPFRINFTERLATSQSPTPKCEVAKYSPVLRLLV